MTSNGGGRSQAVAAVLGVFGMAAVRRARQERRVLPHAEGAAREGHRGVSTFPVRLGGQVKPGSVKWDDKTLDLRFEVTDGMAEVAVHSKGAPPQMFRDGMGVVLEGRYGRDSRVRRDRT